MLTTILILIAFVSLFFLHPVAFRSVMVVIGAFVYLAFWLGVAAVVIYAVWVLTIITGTI